MEISPFDAMCQLDARESANQKAPNQKALCCQKALCSDVEATFGRSRRTSAKNERGMPAPR